MDAAGVDVQALSLTQSMVYWGDRDFAGRLNHGWKVRPECRHLREGPLTYLRRFTDDTIAYAPNALAYLIATVGAFSPSYCDRPET